jgi:plasmid stabilization system protein ParE
MKVHWTAEAKIQLKQIEAYIAQDSPGVARNTITRLAIRCGQLQERPYSGRKVPEFNRDDLRELLERPYRIVYRIKPDADQVDIVTLWHYRRVLPGKVIGA